MQCQQLEQILEQQDAGPLPEAAVAHMEACEACRALTADLDAIRGCGRWNWAPRKSLLPSACGSPCAISSKPKELIHEPRRQPRKREARLVGRFSAPGPGGGFSVVVLVAASLIGYMGQFRADGDASAVRASSRTASSVAFGGQRIQGRIADRRECECSGLATTGRRRDGFHPPEPGNR